MKTPAKKYMDNLFKEFMVPDRLPVVMLNICLSSYFFGQDGLAIFSLLLPIYFLFTVTGTWINFGAMTRAIESIGESNANAARMFSSVALKLSICTGIFLSAVVLIFLDPILSILGVPENLMPMAKSYATILASGGVLLILSTYIMQFLKLLGMLKQMKLIFKVMLVLNFATSFTCARFLDLGFKSMAIGILTTVIFCIVFEGLRLKKTFGQNLFTPVDNFFATAIEVLKSGASMALSKILSLLQIVMFNSFLLKFFGLESVAVFGMLQVAIRLCRTAIFMAIQPITPILTIEFADKCIPAMMLLLKTAMRRGMMFAILPMAVMLIFSTKLVSMSSVDPELYGFAENALNLYALSLIFAAVNTIFLVAFVSTKHVLFSNLIAFVRSFAGIFAFLYFAANEDPTLIWWSFLFAEVSAFLILIIGELILQKKFQFRTPLLLEKKFAVPTNYFVIDRQIGLDDSHKDLPDYLKSILNNLNSILWKSSKGKNDFLAVQISPTQMICRGSGTMYDYRPDLEQLKYDCKFKNVLGLNNFYFDLRK